MKDASLFHTLEPCEDDLIEDALQAIANPKKAISQNLAELLRQLELNYDDIGQTMLVYLAGRAALGTEIFDRFNQDVAISREEIGRLPGVQMNVIEYICTYLKPRSEKPDNGVRIISLLEHLLTKFALRISDEHDFFNNVHGIRLLGFLTKHEVEELEACIEEGGWIADQDELFDDGVAFMMRHLRNHIVAARRNQTGLWLRGHP